MRAMRSRGQLSEAATAVAVFILGFVVSLAGDATHVASATTVYEWIDFPELWMSALWFPFAVAGSVLAAAWIADRRSIESRPHSRGEAVLGAALVLALYALTSALHGQPDTVSVVLCSAVAVAIWAWWNPSPQAFAFALGAAIFGPLAEIGIVELGAASYTPGSDGLAGVAPWLPCIYFAAGAVACGLWGAIRDGER